ncbi:MAG: hypothetical protein M3319_15115 [Actinomycetota bacterium]|nr:hypothetical protein [Actinomycetota bacterium]
MAAATTGAGGKFSTTITIPTNLATGTYTLSAVSAAGRRANITLAVNRQVSTRYYFASFYTGRGYHEYLAFLNPSAIRASVTITYQLKNGTTRAKTISINPRSRFTEDVNADLGVHVSAGAAIAADVPIAAERVVYHGPDGAVVPGTSSPSTSWYFANGNSNKGYREYLAVLNPNTTPVQVRFRFFPAHRAPFTVVRSMAPTSRTTLKVNSFVKAAVGVRITSTGPIVANRSIFIKHGMTSKIGVTSPKRTWYFAAGPRNGAARHWIGAINPSNRWSYVTLRAFSRSGHQVATVRGWLRPFARPAYLINRIARRTDVAVVLRASRPIVAEQMTYIGRLHDASTDTFGVPTAAKSWAFAAANTMAANREADALELFNPNLVPVPIVVQFMTAAGALTERTYVVAPMSHRHVDVGSIQPNAQLGLMAASNYPFVALNQSFFNNRLGSMTSPGVHLP